MRKGTIMRLVNSIALSFAFTAATVAATAQQPKSPVTITPSAETSAPHNWTTEQILTCTVSDCWQLSGKNETTFFNIIQQLAEISAQTRGLTLPDDAAAGQRTGEYIKAKAHTDHGQLLYAIVDAAIRKVGTRPATGTK
jgi:invasion protein IalB